MLAKKTPISKHTAYNSCDTPGYMHGEGEHRKLSAEDGVFYVYRGVWEQHLSV